MKDTKFAPLGLVLSTVLVLLAGVHSALAQVTNLGIAPAGEQSVLYWPTSSTTNYVLQTVTNLSSTNWVPASNAVTVNAVVVTNAAPSGYFRLSESATPAGMAFIPAGAFTMGDTLDGETDAIPVLTITLSAFYMDTNLVSYSEWLSVYNWATAAGYGFDSDGSGVATNHPVQTVNWFDVVKWSNARSQKASLMPVYYTDAGLKQVYTNGDTDAVYANWTANGYRLPTEAEWEKAARGGVAGRRFPWGNIASEIHANYTGNPMGFSYDVAPFGPNYAFDGGVDSGRYPYTSSVGYFMANGYGLFDMAGNVQEWCWDWYGTPLGQPTASNPKVRHLAAGVLCEAAAGAATLI